MADIKQDIAEQDRLIEAMKAGAKLREAEYMAQVSEDNRIVMKSFTIALIATGILILIARSGIV